MPSHVTLDEACHLIGRQVIGLNVSYSPARGHRG
nr:MAG TPA: Protein of unknown function (DUF2767) [Caudoviricetes sp.]